MIEPGGLPIEGFNSEDQSKLKDLVCLICQNVARDIVESTCGHVFCELCIHKWLRRSKTCPLDRKPLTRNNLHPAARDRRMIASMKFTCPTCKKQMQARDYFVHYQDFHAPDDEPGISASFGSIRSFSPSVIVSRNLLTATIKMKPGDNPVRVTSASTLTSVNIAPHVKYYEVKIVIPDPNLSFEIGICHNEKQYSVDSYGRTSCNKTSRYMEPWGKAGDIIGVGYDSKCHQIFFTRQGKYARPATVNVGSHPYMAMVQAQSKTPPPPSREAAGRSQDDVKIFDVDRKEANIDVEKEWEKVVESKAALGEARLSVNFGPRFLFNLKEYARRSLPPSVSTAVTLTDTIHSQEAASFCPFCRMAISFPAGAQQIMCPYCQMVSRVLNRQEHGGTSYVLPRALTQPRSHTQARSRTCSLM
mmetsp:Transcript_34611/g.55691  ORF Transcript_34611/g.55691 Transcript_34611/m.55691 type:complete len:417 (-) Transcript_34611:96-1346(-)